MQVLERDIVELSVKYTSEFAGGGLDQSSTKLTAAFADLSHLHSSLQR